MLGFADLVIDIRDPSASRQAMIFGAPAGRDDTPSE
jgi:hypothetical protein